MVRMGAVDQLRYGMSIKLYGEDKAFGPGIAELLRNVETVSYTHLTLPTKRIV